MTFTALRSLLKAQPFQPFRLVISSGDKYAVRHPEMVFMLRDRVLVAQPQVASDDNLPDDFVTLAYLRIAAVEPMNGHSKKLRRRKK